MLEKRYPSKTRSNILELRYAFYTIKKLSFESIEKYTCKIKDLVDKLATFLVKIDDEEILVHTLNGLLDDLSAFQTSIQTRSGSLALKKLHALLTTEEKIVQKNQTGSRYLTHNHVVELHQTNNMFLDKRSWPDDYLKGGLMVLNSRGELLGV